MLSAPTAVRAKTLRNNTGSHLIFKSNMFTNKFILTIALSLLVTRFCTCERINLIVI